MNRKDKLAQALVTGAAPVKGFSRFGPGGVHLVFGHDMYTPCMVYYKGMSATLGCALHEGEVEGEGLDDKQIQWLGTFEEQADAHIDAVRGPDWKG